MKKTDKLKKQIAICESRLSKMTAVINHRILKEGKGNMITEAMAKEYVTEAIRHERLLIQEAMAGMNQQEMSQLASGLQSALDEMLEQHPNLFSNGAFENMLSLQFPSKLDLEDVKAAWPASKGKMAEYTKALELGVIATKALNAIADDVTEVKPGKIASVLQVLETLGSNRNEPLKNALSAMKTGETPKRGLFARMLGKSGGSADRLQQFKAAVKETLSVNAPGYAAVVDASRLADALTELSLTELKVALETLNLQIQKSKPVSMALDASTQSRGVKGALKGVWDLWSGGGMTKQL